MTLALTAPRARLDLNRMWHDAPAFTGVAAFLTLATAPLLAAMALDDRLFQGESVWIKPLKFHVALAIYLITLAFFARFMPPTGRLWRGFVAAVCVAVLGEILWIGGAASAQTASHFNIASPLMNGLYALMGVFAVLLTSASLVMGVAIHRNSALAPTLRLSLSLGLIATFVLTVIVAGTMSSNLSHFVGTSTRTLPIMGWSRDAGDLRVAHFFATHALHAVPLVGLAASRMTLPQGRATVIAATAAYSAFVLALFVQALAGRPFL
jgi:hypothetical protein